MGKLKIQTGIEMPPKWDSLRTYDWKNMKVGDCVIRDVGYWMTLRVSAFKAAKFFGYKVTVRRIDDNKVGCWRIA